MQELHFKKFFLFLVICFITSCDVLSQKDTNITYWDNGNKKSETIGDSLTKYWYKSGEKWKVETKQNGQLLSFKEFYKNGKLKQEGKDVRRDTIYIDDNETGAIIEKVVFSYDKVKFYENGTIKSKIRIRQAEFDGKQLHYDESGKLKKKEVYKEGELIEEIEY